MTLVEKLKFEGLRIIFPSQGIDTLSEQADVQMTVHGLMDSMYVKELEKRHIVGWRVVPCEVCTQEAGVTDIPPYPLAKVNQRGSWSIRLRPLS